jgi:hypothetical protein
MKNACGMITVLPKTATSTAIGQTCMQHVVLAVMMVMVQARRAKAGHRAAHARPVHSTACTAAQQLSHRMLLW